MERPATPLSRAADNPPCPLSPRPPAPHNSAMARLPLLLAVAFTAGVCTAQNANITTFGSGCASSGPPPLIQFSARPQLGATFNVQFNALPSGQTPVSQDWPILCIGWHQTSVPVPVLSGLQIANCNLLTTSQVLIPMAWLGSSYQSQVPLSVPNNQVLLGFTIYMQWIELYSRCQPTCVPSMIRVSNGAAVTFGL